MAHRPQRIRRRPDNMAGDWIKLEHVTPDKPEIHKIAEILNMDADTIVGKLLRFWIWADQQSISGNAASVTKQLIDRITYAPGFADALLKVDWLQARSGSFAIPHFDRHNGQTAKKRADTNRRVARHRERCNAENVTDVTQQTLQKALPEKSSTNQPTKNKNGRLVGSNSVTYSVHGNQPETNQPTNHPEKPARSAMPPEKTPEVVTEFKPQSEWLEDLQRTFPDRDVQGELRKFSDFCKSRNSVANRPGFVGWLRKAAPAIETPPPKPSKPRQSPNFGTIPEPKGRNWQGWTHLKGDWRSLDDDQRRHILDNDPELQESEAAA
jgi:hypothetical protein